MHRKTAAIVAVLALAAQVAVADDSGTFRMARSYRHSYVTIDHVTESYTGGALTGTVTIVGSSGTPFVVGTHSNSTCLAFARRSAGGITLEAPCVDVDGSGDRLYSVGRRNQGTIGAGGAGGGRWVLLGGTGKYEGITGSCTYETQYLGSDRVAGTADCTWSRSR